MISCSVEDGLLSVAKSTVVYATPAVALLCARFLISSTTQSFKSCGKNGISSVRSCSCARMTITLSALSFSFVSLFTVFRAVTTSAWFSSLSSRTPGA